MIHRKPLPVRFVIGLAFLATGAALIAYIASGVSLLFTALVTGLIAFIVVRRIWAQLPEERRRQFRRGILCGLVAGAIATSAYDLSRFALIKATGIQLWPFDIFRVFGQALMGTAFNDTLTRSAGFAYHIANGLSFGAAYTVWMGNRGILAGIGFAMSLELCMVTLYPGWLGMKALNEFLQISIFGHLIYGTVLGYCAKRFLWKATR